MREKSTIKLSLLCSLTGIAVLYAGAVQMRPGLTPIAKLDNDYVGLKVKVSGQVIDISDHPDGHMFLKLKDDSGGVISVPIFSRIRSGLSENIALLDNMQVTGQIDLYNGELELIPDKAGAIQIVQTPYTGLSRVTRERLGQIIKTRGVISAQEVVGNGNLLMTLRDNGSELKVFVPSSLAELKEFPETQVGYSVGIGGWLQLYHDELELKLEDSINLRIIEAS